jgi:Mn-dependent DtxR family transcriptional regulator
MDSCRRAISESEPLEPIDWEILSVVETNDVASPGIVAFELEYDLGAVYDRLGELRRRGFVRRSDWSGCSLSDCGREYLARAGA